MVKLAVVVIHRGKVCVGFSYQGLSKFFPFFSPMFPVMFPVSHVAVNVKTVQLLAPVSLLSANLDGDFSSPELFQKFPLLEKKNICNMEGINRDSN